MIEQRSKAARSWSDRLWDPIALFLLLLAGGIFPAVRAWATEGWRPLIMVKIHLPAVSHFSAPEHFTSDNRFGVKISELDSSFALHLLPKTETDVPAGQISRYQLPSRLGEQQLAAALDLGAGIPLAHLWELLRRQGQGQDGFLDTVAPNFCYVHDQRGHLRPLIIRWEKEGWRLQAGIRVPQGTNRIWPAGWLLLVNSK